MSIQGISGGFSTNSIIAATRLQARRAILAPEPVEGVEPPIVEIEAPDIDEVRRVLAPEAVGPGVGELTPRPTGERPFGLFRNEYGKDTSKDRREDLTGRGTGDSEEEIQDLVNQIVAGPEDEKDVSDEENTAGDGSLDKANEKSVSGEATNSRPKAGELSEEDQKEVQRLQLRDAEVVAHENAHKAAAGGLATGAIHYDTEKGPDGRSYRTGGHVNINTAKGKTPEETLERAAKIKRAALAPAEPSPQDRAVANKANQMESEARQELAEKRLEEAQEGSDHESSTSATVSAKRSGEGKNLNDDGISGASDRDSTQPPKVQSKSDEIAPGKEPSSIQNFQMNRAVSGYQNSINLANFVSSGSFFRLSA